MELQLDNKSSVLFSQQSVCFKNLTGLF